VKFDRRIFAGGFYAYRAPASAVGGSLLPPERSSTTAGLHHLTGHRPPLSQIKEGRSLGK
jgi:hypothetical protein